MKCLFKFCFSTPKKEEEEREDKKKKEKKANVILLSNTRLLKELSKGFLVVEKQELAKKNKRVKRSKGSPAHIVGKGS